MPKLLYAKLYLNETHTQLIEFIIISQITAFKVRKLDFLNFSRVKRASRITIDLVIVAERKVSFSSRLISIIVGK